MKVTKKQIDTACMAYIEWQRAKQAADKAEKVWKDLLKPIVEYVDVVLQHPPEEPAPLRGTTTLLQMGKRAETRKLRNPVDALVALERKKKGLGYKSITISMKIREAHLSMSDIDALCDKKLGSRVCKGIDLTEQLGVIAPKS